MLSLDLGQQALCIQHVAGGADPFLIAVLVDAQVFLALADRFTGDGDLLVGQLQVVTGRSNFQAGLLFGHP